MTESEITDVHLGLHHYKCAACGKRFYTRANKDEYAYTNRYFRHDDREEMYCSWKCLRKAERAITEADQSRMLDFIRQSDDKTQRLYNRLMARPGVWRRADEKLPLHKCVAAVKVLRYSTNELQLAVGRFLPAGTMRMGASHYYSRLPNAIWVAVDNDKREMRNVVEWYDAGSE